MASSSRAAVRPAKLPPGFKDLNTLASQPVKSAGHDVIAMVCDFMPPTTTIRGDHVITFKLVDPSNQDSISGGNGLMARFFYPPAVADPSTADTPKIDQVGDIILLKGVKLDSFRGELLINNVRGVTQWMVFPIAGMPKGDYTVAYMGGKQELPCTKSRTATAALITLVEKNYILDLARRYGQLRCSFTREAGSRANEPLAIRVPAVKRPASGPETNVERRKLQRPGESKKFRLVSEVQDSSYADLCVEVLKKWQSDFGCELYVTDYTENKLMLYYKTPAEQKESTGRDGDRFDYTTAFQQTKWPGPWGYRVLKVVCMPPHAGYAHANVEVGQHLRLTNVKIRFNNVNMLEGSLWADQRYPDKVCVQVLRRDDLDEVQDIIDRKRQYYAEQKAIEPETAPEGATNEAEGISKSARRRSKKRAKEARKAADEAAQAEAILEQALITNPHTRCSNGTIPLSSIAAIRDDTGERHKEVLPDGRQLALPFVNANYRAKVCVLDFQPSLEDFAVATDELDEDSMDLSIESSQRWEWAFTLLLRDARKSGAAPEDRLHVNVGHTQGQFLLGNEMPDPSSLQEPSLLLKQLREKMYILWGDCEEKKAAGSDTMPSNRPFECCISEYGVLKDGGKPERSQDWVRQYMLHGLTIS